MVGNFDLGQQDWGRGFPGSLAKRPQDLRAGQCAPAQPRSTLRAAGLRMRESLSAPAVMQSLLRYFSPSQAGRKWNRVTPAEKRLCARGTALWNHIRNLVCRGKVGQQVGFVPGGQGRVGYLSPRCLRQLLLLSFCSPSLGAACPWFVPVLGF